MARCNLPESKINDGYSVREYIVLIWLLYFLAFSANGYLTFVNSPFRLWHHPTQISRTTHITSYLLHGCQSNFYGYYSTTHPLVRNTTDFKLGKLTLAYKRTHRFYTRLVISCNKLGFQLPSICGQPTFQTEIAYFFDHFCSHLCWGMTMP